MVEKDDAFFNHSDNGDGASFGSESLPGYSHSTVEENKPETKRPPMYNVVLLNDDFTPMDFVVYVLKKFFHKNHDQAVDIMLSIHQSGQSSCGRYTRDVAETKMMQVINLARANNHPLKCVIRKA